MTLAVEAQQQVGRSLAALSEHSRSRSYMGVTFTVGTGEADDLDGKSQRAILADARTIDPDVDAEVTSIGWGGDSGAALQVAPCACSASHLARCCKCSGRR
jgi:hypothetical protein